MGFKIGRGDAAPVLETKKTARYGEQLVVSTESKVDIDAADAVVDLSGHDEDVQQTDTHQEQKAESVEQPVKAKRGRKAKKA